MLGIIKRWRLQRRLKKALSYEGDPAKLDAMRKATYAAQVPGNPNPPPVPPKKPIPEQPMTVTPCAPVWLDPSPIGDGSPLCDSIPVDTGSCGGSE